MKFLRWDMPERAIPKHPYRDTAIVYAGLAGIVVGVTAATGGNVGKAAIVAAVFFVLATAYSWWRWHVRLRREAKAQAEAEK